MLLEKNNFLSLPEVSDFSEWLSEVSEKLRVELKIKKSRFVENAIETNCVGFQGILDNYHWKSSWSDPFSSRFYQSKNWIQTRDSLQALSRLLIQSIQSGDDEKTFRVCEQILIWGGNRDVRKGATPQLEYLKSKNGLLQYLERAKNIFDGDTISTDNIAQNVKFSGSMWTKIYALNSVSGAPIYDTRVAAAISTLVALFRHETNSSTTKDSLLNFSVSTRVGKRSCFILHNSSVINFNFLQNNSAEWTENTLKLSWIIESVISRRPLLFGDEKNMRTKKHAFEACLFMLGYDTENLKVETNI